MKRTALILILTLGSSAVAEISPDVRKYVGSAAALFEKLEYEKALAQLKRAKAKSQGPEDDLRIALLEGIVLSEMGDANAPAAFATALGMDPNATLPLVVSPKVQKVFDKSKAQVQKVLEAQAEVERQKADERKKQEEANKPPPPAETKSEVVVTQPKPEPKPGLRRLAWIPAAVGVVGVGVGTVLLIQANAASSKLRSDQPATREEALAIANSGANMQVAGWTLVGVGSAAVVAAAGLFLFGGSSSDATAGVMFSNQGAAATLTVPLPY